MAKHIQKTLSRNLSVSASVDKTVIRGETGRRTHVGDDFYLVKAWSEVPTLNDMRSHFAAARFQDEIAKVSHRLGNDLVCVRGRPYDETIDGWERMGPPAQAGKEGRYNSASQVVLYLCDSEEGVRREFSLKLGGKLFLQEYILPLGSLQLADFSVPDPNEFTSAVFDRAEISGEDSRIGRHDFEFSQLVADLVREGGFQGMLVPGVHGDSEFRYLNVVVFDPPAASGWRVWSQKGKGFRNVVV